MLHVINITLLGNEKHFVVSKIDQPHVLVHLVVGEVPRAHCEIVSGLMLFHAEQVLLFLLFPVISSL